MRYGMASADADTEQGVSDQAILRRRADWLRQELRAVEQHLKSATDADAREET
jgi:hypothetical protein